MPRRLMRNLCVEALARQAPWRHLLQSWLVQSKPGWSPQACTRQAQSALGGARRRVCPEPKGKRCLHKGRNIVSVPELDSSLSCSDIRFVEPMSGFLTEALDGLRVAPDLDCDEAVSCGCHSVLSY